MITESRLLRIGIIGCGALGLVHAQRLCALHGVEICAVSDPDEPAMQRVAASQQNAANIKVFPDYRDLLKVREMDAVCINSPNRWHVEQLLAGLDCGLHVLCEKPLSMIPSEVEQVVQATKRAGTTVAIAYQSRYRRDSRILRRALQSGKWGKITSVDIFTGEDWMTPNRGTWRHDPDRCPGGFFADANGHQLDLLFWLTGMEAQSLRATIETRGTPVPMVTWGEARIGEIVRTQEAEVSGRQQPSTQAYAPAPVNEQPCINRQPHIPFTFTFVGDARHWREEISIQTERADFVMRNTRLLWSTGGELAPYSDPENDLPASDLDYTPDAAFIAALRGGPPVVSPPHTVWPVLKFTLAALESARVGGVVEVR